MADGRDAFTHRRSRGVEENRAREGAAREVKRIPLAPSSGRSAPTAFSREPREKA